jgi:hypothetical protein
MNSGNPSIDFLFDGLSSIYRKDNGMVHSNLYTFIGAYGEVFADAKRKYDQIANNRYINTADPDALQDNFGVLIDFPKPPRLNTLSNGDEIYRSMLRAMFKVFQSGSTNASMNLALDTAASFLTIDPRTEDAVTVINYTTLLTVDNQIELTWHAVKTSGDFVVGVADPSDIIFFPQDLIVTNYNDDSRIISFTGTVNTGVQYQIIYSRDNTSYRGTNWINTEDSTEVLPSPFMLRSGTIPTFNDPQFSYWWSTYNADGQGVVIDEFSLNRTESSLAWRLPEKTIQFISPFNSDNVLTRTIEFYNNSGLAYDINVVNDTNPDVLFSDIPLNYYTDVSADYTDYYVRYSNNNSGPYIALDQFTGAMPKFLKKYKSIEFSSQNFGTLDFFEKNDNFNVNDLFGSGTRNIWLNVENIDGRYILSNENIYSRDFSLHEKIFYLETFSAGNLNNITSTYPAGVRISDLVGVPLTDKEDCLMVIGPSSGVNVAVSPILSPETLTTANHVEVDIFDGLNSGTATYIDVIRTGTSGEYNKFRFGIDIDTSEFEFSTSDPFAISKDFGFVETYFENSVSTTRTVTVSGLTSHIMNPYTYSTGTNPNILFSNTSLVVTGESATITPNASNSLISNTDKLSVQFQLANSMSFNITNVKFYGTGNITSVPFYNQEVFSMSASAGDTYWNFASQTYSFDPNTELFTPTLNGGVSTIPVSTGISTVEFLKGSGLVVDGVLYGSLGSLDNPAINWNNIGTSQSNLGSPNSLVITASSGTVLDHYELSNQALKTQFYETVANYSGITTATLPYYYQIFTDPNNDVAKKHYLLQFPRTFGWNRLKVDFGTNYSGLSAYLGENLFYGTGTIGFAGYIHPTSGVSLNSDTYYPESEFSYFDNIKASYYDANSTLGAYQVAINLQEDWAGSALSDSTIVDNKFFELDPQPNFQFNVLIKGLDESFIFIMNKIIEKLKPAHTIATSVFEKEQFLDTTTLVPIISNTGTDWETGNIMNNIIIKSTGQNVQPTLDLPGYITISGSGI